jgi:hypothetical protein
LSDGSPRMPCTRSTARNGGAPGWRTEDD